MLSMTLEPSEEDTVPDRRRRFHFPAGIFHLVRPGEPASRLDGPRRMLRHPGFWGIMAVLTVLMTIGALTLSDHLQETRLRHDRSGPVTYALPR